MQISDTFLEKNGRYLPIIESIPAEQLLTYLSWNVSNYASSRLQKKQ